jgi:hypothetical protein
LWHATASGRPAHGCDVLRTGLDGRISEITVYVRPATGVAALAAAMGGPLAALRRPRARRAVAAASAPLPHLAAAIDLSAAFVAGIPRSSRVG